MIDPASLCQYETMRPSAAIDPVGVLTFWPRTGLDLRPLGARVTAAARVQLSASEDVLARRLVRR